jgi:lysophospholipase L1-like esterase
VFSIGETAIQCTATDADNTHASCAFGVTVRVSRTIARTKFLAFGDSITAGAVSVAPLIMLARPDGYPFKLEQMLQQRYPGQPVVVIEHGFGGEDTREGARRLPAILQAEQPEVLLLLEGINNINALMTSRQASGLRTMIEEAQLRRVEVIIATVMPVRPTWRHYQPGNTSSKIEALNTEILVLAAQYGLGPPVDLFALFQANMHLIGADGLHPTVEGQTRIAEAFRDEIVRRYDSASPTTLHLSKMRLSQ